MSTIKIDELLTLIWDRESIDIDRIDPGIDLNRKILCLVIGIPDLSESVYSVEDHDNLIMALADLFILGDNDDPDIYQICDELLENGCCQHPYNSLSRLTLKYIPLKDLLLS